MHVVCLAYLGRVKAPVIRISTMGQPGALDVGFVFGRTLTVRSHRHRQ
jgi:hypothetical protein